MRVVNNPGSVEFEESNIPVTQQRLNQSGKTLGFGENP